jgi:hypothetical protein
VQRVYMIFPDLAATYTCCSCDQPRPLLADARLILGLYFIDTSCNSISQKPVNIHMVPLTIRDTVLDCGLLQAKTKRAMNSDSFGHNNQMTSIQCSLSVSSYSPGRR